MAQKPVTIVIMPKLVGIPYYVSVKRDGVDRAAAELPDARIIWLGPSQPLVQRQIRLIKKILPLQPDVIAVAANDAQKIQPILKQAADQGCHIMSWDADTNFREIFVNLVDYQQFGNNLVQTLVQQMGSQGRIAIVTTSFSAPNQSRWIKAIQQTISSFYPGLSIVAIRPAGESTENAMRITKGIIRDFPGIKGIIALGAPNLPGAAQALASLNLEQSIALTGNSTPNMMKPHVKKGIVKRFWAWDVPNHGYLSVYTAYNLARGRIAAGKPFVAGKLGTFVPRKDARGLFIIPGDPLTFDAENIDEAHF
jgi:ABC-type sugar transport system substrate-binding protein